METDTGRPFGYELTFFRRALTPQLTLTSNSQWRSNQVYFAHFTISDIAANKFYPKEQFSRGAANVANAQAEPYAVLLNNWSVSSVSPGKVQLKAETDKVSLDLILEQTLPPVLQGHRRRVHRGSRTTKLIR